LQRAAVHQKKGPADNNTAGEAAGVVEAGATVVLIKAAAAAAAGAGRHGMNGSQAVLGSEGEVRGVMAKEGAVSYEGHAPQGPGVCLGLLKLL
jgi:hypothetical protein